jgi:hypothetical protein
MIGEHQITHWHRELFLVGPVQPIGHQEQAPVAVGPRGDPVETMCGGRFVRCAAWPEDVAYMKPTRSGNDHAPAREKLAADLAGAVGVPVPPALLYRRGLERGTEPERVVLGLRVAELAQNLSFVRDVMEGSYPRAMLGPLLDLTAAALRRDAPGGVVFDLWVDQLDHGEGIMAANNIILGVDEQEKEARLWYLDYEKALFLDRCTGMHLGGPAQAPPPPAWLLRRLDRDAAHEAVARIRSLPEASISALIHRIPSDYLPAEHKSVIEHELLSRRESLSERLAALLEQR